MKRSTFFLILALGVVPVLALASVTKVDVPAEDKAFWEYITKANPYTKWPMMPGWEEMYEGKSPHGAFLKLYLNQPALKAVMAGQPMPPGSILVKENYGQDKKTLMAVTPMYRVKGYNPDGGDWFWGKYGPDGKVMAAGKVEGCINCHSAVKEADWIFTKPR